MSKRRIHLHGKLRALYDGVLELDATSVAEAINGFCRILKIRVDPVRGRMPVKILGFDTAESLYAQSDTVDLHVFPAFSGAKGIFQVIIGAILIAVAIIAPFGMSAIVATALLSMGASMLLGGILELLAPVPKGPKQADYLGQPGNTTANGTPIPLLFGTMMAFGQYISFNIESSYNDSISSTSPTAITGYSLDTAKTSGDVLHATIA